MSMGGFEPFINNIHRRHARFQSQLGRETQRIYKEGENVVRITLARVVKVNYKYNTVDVVTTLHKNSTDKDPNDNGRFSARLPVSFGGKTPDGNVYGATTLVTNGSLVLIGFIEGNKDFPIVLNIYGDVDNQSQLTRTTFTSADESDENIQQELWQLFNLYPSMTYHNIDGNGNQEVTFSGRTFLIVSDTDPDNEYIQDAEFDYEHLPNSRYANGDQIEPKSPQAPSVLYVHQGVYDDHRVTMFIKSDGTLRVGSRHLDGNGITYQELTPDGRFEIAQKDGTVDPEDIVANYTSISVENNVITLSSDRNKFEVKPEGVFVNGVSIGAMTNERLDRLEEEILEQRTSLQVLDGRIELKADRTVVNGLTDRVTRQEGELIVAFDQIAARVTKEEYHTLARGSNNELYNTSYMNPLNAYGEGTQLDVSNGDPNTLTVRRAGADESFGVFIGDAYPMTLYKDQKYSLSFEGIFPGFTNIDNIWLVSEGEFVQKIETLEVKEDHEDFWEYPLYHVVFQPEQDFRVDDDDNGGAYLMFGMATPEGNSFSIRRVQIEKGEERTPWYPSYKDFAVSRIQESNFKMLSDRITLNVRELNNLDERVTYIGDDLEDAMYRLNEAEIGLQPDNIYLKVSETFGYQRDRKEIEDYVKETTDAIERDITGIRDIVDGLDDILDDLRGDITEAEAKAIAQQLNALNAEKESLDAKYAAIIEKPEYNEDDLDLYLAKQNFDAAHKDLVDYITEVVTDLHITEEEIEEINRRFRQYSIRLSTLSKEFDNAIEYIAQKKADKALEDSKNYTNAQIRILKDEITLEVNRKITEEVTNSIDHFEQEIIGPINQDLDSLRDSVDDFEYFLEHSFRDGVISMSEAKAIQRQLDNLEAEKANIDARYVELSSNTDLSSSVRAELDSAKSGFNTAYDNLITSINRAIQGGETTPEQAADVTEKFRVYSNLIESLSRQFERAANDIAQRKADRARNEAIDHADSEFEGVKSTLDEAMFKLQPDQITLTVTQSQQYRNDLGELVKETEIISAINATAEEIRISSSKIRISGDTIVEDGSFQWGAAKGGTLQLGGEGNENGVLQVLNSDGDVIADLDGDRGGFTELNVGWLTSPSVMNYNSDSYTLYVNPVSGNDDLDGRSWANAKETVQSAIDSIPKNNDGGVEIQVFIDGGAGVTMNENLTIDGFQGSGSVFINFRHRNSVLNGWIRVRACTNYIRIYDVSVHTKDAQRAVYVDRSNYVMIDQLDIYGNNSTDIGVFVSSGSQATVRNCRIRDVNNCIALHNARGVCESSKGYGNDYGIVSRWGSSLSVVGSCPGGKENFETTSSGGRLYYSHQGLVGSDVVARIEEVVDTWGLADPTPPPPPPPPPDTREWSASSSRSWRTQGGWRTDNTKVYQGQWGHGMHKGLWFFGDSVRNAVNGRRITRIRVWLSRRSEGGYSSATGAVIRAHNYASQPGGEPNYLSPTFTENFRWGQSKWVTLPSSFHSVFQNGQARGIGIYTTSSNSREYMIFNGNAKIEITYQ